MSLRFLLLWAAAMAIAIASQNVAARQAAPTGDGGAACQRIGEAKHVVLGPDGSEENPPVLSH